MPELLDEVAVARDRRRRRQEQRRGVVVGPLQLLEEHERVPVVDVEVGGAHHVGEEAQGVGVARRARVLVVDGLAKRLDSPIFMAVSERGGKNNSGDYEYELDEETGSLVEFPDGHPQEGQLVVSQDLVNYDLTLNDLADAISLPDDKLCIAEAFVRFAKEQKFDFWEGK